MPIEPIDDGLIIPEVGVWSKEKYHFLGRYLNAFMVAMKNKPWSGLHYIDLFAGAGMARIKTSREVVFGSGLLAATTTHPFTSIRLAEADAEKAAALEVRLARAGAAARARVIRGDANVEIDKILDDIPPRSLCMTFIDPYGLHADFETVRRLSEVRSDLIVLMPDHMDALRNWRDYYESNPESNLDRFLGVGVGWRAAFNAVPQVRRAQELRRIYESQLKTLGYEHFDIKRISRPDGTPLYVLVYASRSNVGLKIWRGVTSTDAGGQRGFDFA